jgi:hypothetical protein
VGTFLAGAIVVVIAGEIRIGEVVEVGAEAVVTGGNKIRATLEENGPMGGENADPIADCGAKLHVDGKLKRGASVRGVSDSVEGEGAGRSSGSM